MSKEEITFEQKYNELKLGFSSNDSSHKTAYSLLEVKLEELDKHWEETFTAEQEQAKKSEKQLEEYYGKELVKKDKLIKKWKNQYKDAIGMKTDP